MIQHDLSWYHQHHDMYETVNNPELQAQVRDQFMMEHGKQLAWESENILDRIHYFISKLGFNQDKYFLQKSQEFVREYELVISQPDKVTEYLERESSLIQTGKMLARQSKEKLDQFVSFFASTKLNDIGEIRTFTNDYFKNKALEVVATSLEEHIGAGPKNVLQRQARAIVAAAVNPLAPQADKKAQLMRVICDVAREVQRDPEDHWMAKFDKATADRLVIDFSRLNPRDGREVQQFLDNFKYVPALKSLAEDTGLSLDPEVLITFLKFYGINNMKDVADNLDQLKKSGESLVKQHGENKNVIPLLKTMIEKKINTEPWKKAIANGHLGPIAHIISNNPEEIKEMAIQLIRLQKQYSADVITDILKQPGELSLEVSEMIYSREFLYRLVKAKEVINIITDYEQFIKMDKEKLGRLKDMVHDVLNSVKPGTSNEVRNKLLELLLQDPFYKEFEKIHSYDEKYRKLGIREEYRTYLKEAKGGTIEELTRLSATSFMLLMP